jgi:hypothetical protein
MRVLARHKFLYATIIAFGWHCLARLQVANRCASPDVASASAV